MNALAHFFETAGIATTGISLIREHTEQMQPPRLLWVPFPLGRPLGRPGDTAFQHRVIGAALALLDAPVGPVLVDFEEACGTERGSESAWACPLPAPKPEPGDPRRDRMERELARFAPWYALGCERRGRTTFGASGLDLAGVVDLLLGFVEAPGQLSGEVPEFMRLKHAAEDLKVFYLEAAVALSGAEESEPSPESRVAWFWRDTEAGDLLFAVAEQARASSHPVLRTLGERALVPRGIGMRPKA